MKKLLSLKKFQNKNQDALLKKELLETVNGGIGGVPAQRNVNVKLPKKAGTAETQKSESDSTVGCGLLGGKNGVNTVNSTDFLILPNLERMSRKFSQQSYVHKIQKTA